MNIKLIKVISAFAGSGKTTLAKEYGNLFSDIDSANYKFDLTEEQKKMPIEQQKGTVRVKSKLWPQNYLDAIIKEIAEGKVVLISQHKLILDLLRKNNIDFIFVIPTKDSKNEYVKRWKQRGNSTLYIEKRLASFDEDIDYALNSTEPHIILNENEYLVQVLQYWL